MATTGLRELAQLEGHKDRVWCVAWSPKGDYLASCSGDSTAKLWRKVGAMETDEGWVCMQTLEEHDRTVRSVAWSPCGSMLATCSFDSRVVVWQRDDETGLFDILSVLEGHENEVKCVSWSHDGRYIATCGRDKTVWIWEKMEDAESDFDCISVLNGHAQDVKSVVWHPLKESLISTSYDDSIRFWEEESEDWECREVLKAHGHTVWMASIERFTEGEYAEAKAKGSALSATRDPYNPRMATCSSDSKVVVWQVAPGMDGNRAWRNTCTLTGYHDGCTIYATDWSSMNYIATAASDDSIRVFREAEAAEDGDRATDGAPTSSWTLATEQIRAHNTEVNCVRWHPSDPNLLASGADDGTIKLWRFTP